MSQRYDKGMRTRREVLGDEHVDRSVAATTDLDAEFQTWITESVWGDLWTDPRLDKKTRSMVTIAILGALRADELALHLGASMRTGVTREELAQVLRHVAAYAGVPAAHAAFGKAKAILGEWAATRDHDADDPPSLYPPYRSTIKRAPLRERVRVPRTLSELTGPGPVFALAAREDADLTTNAGTGAPALGERSIVTGRVLDEDGSPIAGALVEVWQADASGRYAHPREKDFPAPRDPNFIGQGACKTDAAGVYSFTTIKPGPYPWGNHPNAWRPAHIHLSVYGPSLGTRLVTQMYFPGDPLLELDPIFQSVPEAARGRLVSRYDHSVTRPNWALGYRFDIVLAGPDRTPSDAEAP